MKIRLWSYACCYTTRRSIINIRCRSYLSFSIHLKSTFLFRPIVSRDVVKERFPAQVDQAHAHMKRLQDVDELETIFGSLLAATTEHEVRRIFYIHEYQYDIYQSRLLLWCRCSPLDRQRPILAAQSAQVTINRPYGCSRFGASEFVYPGVPWLS
jgi:hypothetical protein